MTNYLRHTPADGTPMPRGPAVVDHLALIDLVGAPSDDAVGLDAVFRDQFGDVLLDQRHGLSSAAARVRKPSEGR
jgi:hypothetical protein